MGQHVPEVPLALYEDFLLDKFVPVLGIVVGLPKAVVRGLVIFLILHQHLPGFREHVQETRRVENAAVPIDPGGAVQLEIKQWLIIGLWTGNGRKIGDR